MPSVVSSMTMYDALATNTQWNSFYSSQASGREWRRKKEWLKVGCYRGLSMSRMSYALESIADMIWNVSYLVLKTYHAYLSQEQLEKLLSTTACSQTQGKRGTVSFFFLISNCNYYIKSAKERNPYTREVYKRTPKRDEQRINLKSLHK